MKHHSDKIRGRSLPSSDQVTSNAIGHIIRDPALRFVDIAFYQVVSEVNMDNGHQTPSSLGKNRSTRNETAIRSL